MTSTVWIGCVIVKGQRECVEVGRVLVSELESDQGIL
jgi:hypothetical protein